MPTRTPLFFFALALAASTSQALGAGPPAEGEILFHPEPIGIECSDLLPSRVRDGEGIDSQGRRYRSIQEALDTAPSGSVITLGAGRYCVNLNLPPRDITLRGVDAKSVILDGSGCRHQEIRRMACSVIRGYVAEGETATGAPTVEHLTLTGGRGTSEALEYNTGATSTYGGGLFIAGLPATLSDLIIDANEACSGGGAYLRPAEGLSVSRVTLKDNRAELVGGGLMVAMADGAALLSEVTAEGNNASTEGGGIYSAGALVLEGATITENYAVNNGGGIHASQGLEGRNLHVMGNLSSQNGGGLFAGGDVSLEAVWFEGNDSQQYGGGAYLRGPSLSLTAATFEGNDARDGGGLALFASEAISLTDLDVRSNTADVYGGGVLAHFNTHGAPTTMTLTGGTFMENAAGHAGGGLKISTDGPTDATIETSTITGNESGAHGGGLHLGAGNALSLTDVDLTHNTAERSGGGLYMDQPDPDDPTHLSTQGVRVEGNSAGEDGGGMCITGGSLGLAGLEVIGNAAQRGGGVAIAPDHGSDVTLGLPFEGGVSLMANTAEVGGGLFVQDVRANLTGLTLEANAAELSGGGAYILSSSVTHLRASANTAKNGGGAFVSTSQLSDITLVGNHATDSGGGLRLSQGGELSRAWLAANSAAELGGGLIASGSSASLSHIAAVGNTARAGGGLYLYDHTGGLAAMTVAANVATGGVGGGLYMDEGAPSATGLVVVGNQGGAAHNDVKCSGGCAISHSVIDGGAAGVTQGDGLRFADPLLRGLPAPGSAAGADLHLSLGSPAIDLGGRPADPDDSPTDAGIYSQWEGARWDVDADGLPAYFWPGAYGDAPDGVDPSGYDEDDGGP